MLNFLWSLFIGGVLGLIAGAGTKEGKAMLNFLWSLFIGGVLGLIAGAILGKEVPGGVSGNIIIGFLGSWLGEFLLGPLGPELGGFYLIPALLGAIFCLALYSFVARRIRERPKKE